MADQNAKLMPNRKIAILADEVSVTFKTYATGKAVGLRQVLTGGKGLRTVNAVKSVSFTAYEGESIGVIGTNGSGKSTLMRAISGLIGLSSGRVFSMAQPSLLGIGASLISELSGSKNIILGCLAMGMTRAEAEARHDDIVEFSGIGDFIDLPMRTYSSGMSARLRFAISASRDHDILIVDEALSVGDQDFRTRSEARIRELRDNAGTVFLVSHSMKSILDTCDRVLWMNKGVLVQDGPAESVIADYQEFAKQGKGAVPPTKKDS